MKENRNWKNSDPVWEIVTMSAVPEERTREPHGTEVVTMFNTRWMSLGRSGDESKLCPRQVLHQWVVVCSRPWDELEGAYPVRLQAASNTTKTATSQDPVSHYLHISKHQQLALSTKTHVCFCFHWVAEEKTPMWLEIAYAEFKNSICSRETCHWCSWQGSHGAAVRLAPGSTRAHGARAVKMANIRAQLPNQKKRFSKLQVGSTLIIFPRHKGMWGTEKCASLLFHISLLHFQSLEWKVKGTKGQPSPVPSLSRSPAVKESRICVIQIIFLILLKGFRSPVPTSISRECLRNLPWGILGITHQPKTAGPQERPIQFPWRVCDGE